MSAPDFGAAFAAYMVEGRELQQTLEQGLLHIEQQGSADDPELIHALFRAAHTIKGSAGIVGIDSLGRFTHHVETLLDGVRDGRLRLEGPLLGVLLRCCDHIGRLLDLAELGDMEGQGLMGVEGPLVAELAALAGGAAPVAETTGSRVAPALPAGAGFRLFASFGRDCLRFGIDPAVALLYLGQQMPLDTPVMLTSRIPVLEDLDPEDCLIALGVQTSVGSADKALEAFEFCADGTQIVICPPGRSTLDLRERLAPLRAELGEEAVRHWQQAGLMAEAEWPKASATGTSPSDETRMATGAPTPAPAFVRVPADRLDQLNQQVGELVIAGATADELARDTRHPRLLEALSQLCKLIDSIQASALQLRMVPIGETFSRFQRVVRDVARDLGKEIALEISGGDTELDKAMVERIGDPLMHLVRNAMDHGLESPAERVAAGKPAKGALRLRAFHDAGNVVIEVADDGRGLDSDRILAKARARGLVAPNDAPSDQEIQQLIFEPGFSTAEAVTALSGRGVGMDVVRSSVQALRGSISLRSTFGEGTLVQIRLPLTLAIIDGFMVGVGRSRFILPLDMVVECIELPTDAMQPDAPHYLDLRGEVLPYVALRDAFGLRGPAASRPSVVVVRSGDVKTGILVDTLLGEMQTVIKPMSSVFRQLRAICGTSILGSGDIALIVDVHVLLQMAHARHEPVGRPAASATV